MIKINFIIIFSISLSFSTAQVPDFLKYNEKNYTIYGFLLSTKMDSVLKNNYLESFTCNHDRFRSSLVVKDDKLFIEKINAGFILLPDSIVDHEYTLKYFGVQIPDSGLFAGWFSGTITHYYGKDFIAHAKSNYKKFRFSNGKLQSIEDGVDDIYLEVMKSRRKKIIGISILVIALISTIVYFDIK